MLIAVFDYYAKSEGFTRVALNYLLIPLLILIFGCLFSFLISKILFGVWAIMWWVPVSMAGFYLIRRMVADIFKV